MKKNHLTEKDLIEYQFKLASQDQITQADEHLKECEKCQQLNERLAAKFSLLELLREEPQLNEELICRVLEDVKASRQAEPSSRTFKIPSWIGTAAAVLLVASLLVVSEIGEQRKIRPTEGVGIDKPQDKESEKPSFALANAITPVVQPSRESMQITTYNSMDSTLAREKRTFTLKNGWKLADKDGNWQTYLSNGWH